MMKHIDIRLVPPVLISLILLAAHVSFGILRGLDAILLAIGTSIAAEFLFCRLYWGNWPHPASAYTTGISVGILMRSPMLWPFALCSTLSILSKYVLRIRDRHLWNPSNFGVSVLFFPAAYGMLPVAPLSVQWGNNMWAMVVIWIIGLITIWRVKRVHITATYIVAFVVLSYVRSLVVGGSFLAEVAPITGPMYQLFALFMITDPKTTVSSKKGEVVVTILIAVVEFFFRLAEFVAAPFYALFVVGPLAMLVDLYRKEELGDMEKAASPADGASRTQQ